MSDLSTPGDPHSSLACALCAWWYGHSRERQRTMRLWLGVAGGLAAMALLCAVLRTMA